MTIAIASPVARLSRRALSTPEPLVRAFARRVQQEGALDLTQGDYKNADFTPHPEVVRAAQRITRNSVHSYGSPVGRLDVRSEIAELVNRDGLRDYPDSGIRFLPDEVIFTPGTRSGLAMILEVLGEDGSGVVVPRPSWEYDWFIERAGKRVVELPTSAPDFIPDPAALRRLLARGGVSSLILNNPHNPTGCVYPRALVEELVGIAVEHGVFVLYDAVYQRLDYIDGFVNPAFANAEWRDWVVLLSGLSKMDMFGASTGARACWMVLSDQIRADGIRAREIVANLSAWLVATPSTLAQDWAMAALQSPLAALRRPSPQMRARRDFMIAAADAIAHLGIVRTDCDGTFYAPLAFPGLLGEPFERRRDGFREQAVVRSSTDVFDFLLAGGVGGIPFVAFAGSDASRYGTWQRLSYGSKDVSELAVFMERVKACIERQGQLGSSASPQVAWPAETRSGADDKRRITGTKHPDSTTHREEQLRRALASAPINAPDRAARVLAHLDWHPLVDAQREFEETIADLLGPCNEVMLDFEGRQISPEWLDLPQRVVLELLNRGIVPGRDRHVLVRVPNPWLEPDEEKIAKILAAIARANLVFRIECERRGILAAQNAIHELSVPQINSRADLGALQKIATMHAEEVEQLHGIDARFIEPVQRVRLVPLVENVGTLAHLPELLAALPSSETSVRVFIAMSDTAEQSGKIATDIAYTLAVASRDAVPREVTFLVGAGRAGFRGGFDPAHPGVIRQFSRADGVTLQGIRADAPELAQQLADALRTEPMAASPIEDRAPLLELMHQGVEAHTAMLLRIAPLVAPFNGLVPQTRVRIRSTGSVSYGRSIPEYPEECGGFPDARDLRDAWPEGVALPRAINFNLACTTLGLPAVVSDLGVLNPRAAALLDRHVPGYREIIASELPSFVREPVALIFGKTFAEQIAQRCLHASATLWIDGDVREELVAPASLFAMLYLRYLADDSDAWDETKEHESTRTREEELIRETGSAAFSALCRLRPGDRWSLLQKFVDHDDAPRLLLSRELTPDEKRECVDLRIARWLRTLPDVLARSLRAQWSPLRELRRAELTLTAIETMIALERLRGGKGA
jgi:aspartate/methionine/tyrosine aminotransferase/phosphoenolpyruvate carboxylase